MELQKRANMLVKEHGSTEAAKQYCQERADECEAAYKKSNLKDTVEQSNMMDWRWTKLLIN